MSTYTQASMKGLLMVRFGVIQALKMLAVDDNILNCSVQFSYSVMSDSLRPHGSWHTRPPCPSPTPRVHPDSCPSSQWCHPAISSSVVPFSCPQSLPASESFPMSQLLTWGGQSTGHPCLWSCVPNMETQSLILSVHLWSCRSSNSLKIHTMLFLTRDTVLIAIPLGSI